MFTVFIYKIKKKEYLWFYQNPQKIIYYEPLLTPFRKWKNHTDDGAGTGQS